MDLLSQYRHDRPEASRSGPQWQPPKEYGFFIRLVMRLSGGRVRDVNVASYVLLGAAILIFVAAFVLIVLNFNILPAPRFSEDQAKKQMEEYKKIQPF